MDSAKVDRSIEDVFDVLEKCTDKPEKFLSVQSDVAKRLCVVTKKLYDLTKSLEPDTSKSSDALSELILEGFDDEQVWQELELQNDPSLAQYLDNVSRISAASSLQFAGKHSQEKNKKDNAERIKKRKQPVDEDTSDDEEEKEDEEDSVEGDLEDEDMEDQEDLEDDQDDPLRLDKGDDESDMSEDDKAMVALLAKVRAELPPEGGSDDPDDGDGINDDFSIEKLGVKPNSAKKSSAEKSDDNTPEKKTSGRSALKKKKKKMGVDDTFFHMTEMENFLDQEDAKEERKIARESGKMVPESDDSSEEEIDYFADIPSDEEVEINYDDFFDPPDDVEMPQSDPKKKKQVQFSQSDEDSDEDDGGSEQEDQEDDNDEESSEGEDVSDVLGSQKGKQSAFQKRQERVKEKIGKLEEEALKDKDWQMKGEIGSTSRPENSLLQEDLDFEHTTRLAPVITEETTKSLEDMIKQRIKDKAWDDVERKEKPKEEAQQYKKRLVLDQEKSKLSLGEIYEQEYQKQQETEEKEEKDPAREDIQKSMQSLFIKLDALSNFHYTPKPAAPDLKVVSNLPSVAMEEVAPVGVSNAMLLAPEEVQEKQKGELKGTTEKSDTDRKKERREKKVRQREKYKHQEAKQKALEKKGLGNKYAKEKAMRDLEKQSKTAKGINIIKEDKKSKKSGLTSSNQFFTQLQEEVTAHIQSKKAAKKQKKTSDKSATKFKL